MTNSNKEQLQQTFPPQHQDQQPGIQTEMNPIPKDVDPSYKGSEKLKGKTAIITGGDSGIGRSVAIYYAKEGADITIVYLDEHDDAQKTKELVEAEGVKCLLLAGDIGDEGFCKEVVKRPFQNLARLIFS